MKLLALDVDGVLTDGRIFYGHDGEYIKVFHARDGLALNILRKSGVEIAAISGRSSAALIKRLTDLGVQHQILGCKDKVSALVELAGSMDISLEDCVFIGDDWLDLAVMSKVGYSAAPADAAQEILEIADYVSKQPGGYGAVREICEHILARQGKSLYRLYLEQMTGGHGLEEHSQ